MSPLTLSEKIAESTIHLGDENAAYQVKSEMGLISPVDEDHPLHLVNRFQACLLGDMLVYKLGAFLQENDAELVHVEDNFVVLRIGKRRFLPSWYGCSYSRPIEISLRIADDEKKIGRSTAKMCNVETCIKPVGWVRDKEAYKNKVRELIRSLHAYFMAS